VTHGGNEQRGLIAAVGAYGIWGLLPLYFRALGPVPPMEVVSHRILWSVVLLLVILYFRRGYGALRQVLTSHRLLLPLVASAALIAANWLIYIWAVQHGHVIGSSLGYFLIPMLNVLLGFAVLGERLTRLQWIAVALAGAGVAVLAAGALSTLWISLSLALTFGFYGLIRKLIPTGPMVGLAAETLLLAPFAAAGIALWAARGTLAFGHVPLTTDLLLIAGGAITTVPLLLFAYGAQRLRMATLGLLQYIGPTIQLLLGLFLFGEPLTHAHMIAFPLIWAALALYSWSALRASRAAAAR
jgi:chloramphenicol-sensitive protein RarD